jgi:mannose-6-phosphate isomerase
VEALDGPIRDYAWGSRTIIATMQGRPVPSAGPEAELWFGAHPAAPAQVRRDGVAVSFAEVIAADPVRWLGPEAVSRFGPRLPYLLKLLAPDEPLSLQAHPDAEQARAGYAAEEAAPPGTPRNYVDPYHKPELLVAHSRFDALCGFREPLRSAELLAAFGVPALDPVVAALRAGPDGLAEAVRTLLTWPSEDRATLVAAVTMADVPDRFAESSALARRLASRYPEDPGVVVALLLNQVRLAPGEAIWMPAGNLHAYLRGAGVEILAASDNVLRGGLTGKRVDVAELLRVLRFEPLDEPVIKPVPVAPGVVTWPVPVPDFALRRVRVDSEVPRVTLLPCGTRVVLCVRGAVTVTDADGGVPLTSGLAAVGAASGGQLTLTGDGEVYVASVGLDAVNTPKSEISGSA